jgi:hypothetical protein
MNEKQAKQLRREAREECAKALIPLPTIYRHERHTVEFTGAYGPGLRADVSASRAQKLDRQHDLAKAKRYGVVPDWLLQELFGDLKFARVQRVLGPCVRGVYQRTKRALT